MTVLAPVEGTEPGLEAFRTAVELADRLDVEVDPVHVTSERSEEDWNLLKLAQELLDEHDFEAEPRILIEEGADGAGASKAAGERLVEEIEGYDYEFVVVGHHDEDGPVERALLGSATNVIIEETEIPIMLA